MVFYCLIAVLFLCKYVVRGIKYELSHNYHLIMQIRAAYPAHGHINKPHYICMHPSCTAHSPL